MVARTSWGVLGLSLGERDPLASEKPTTRPPWTWRRNSLLNSVDASCFSLGMLLQRRVNQAGINMHVFLYFDCWVDFKQDFPGRWLPSLPRRAPSTVKRALYENPVADENELFERVPKEEACLIHGY